MIKPLFDRVLIKPDEETENKTKSGIILATSTKEKPQTGVIVATGDGGIIDGEKVEMKLKKDDRVLYTKYVGTEIKIDGKDYIILKQIDVLAIIEEK